MIFYPVDIVLLICKYGWIYPIDLNIMVRMCLRISLFFPLFFIILYAIYFIQYIYDI